MYQVIVIGIWAFPAIGVGVLTGTNVAAPEQCRSGPHLASGLGSLQAALLQRAEPLRTQSALSLCAEARGKHAAAVPSQTQVALLHARLITRATGHQQKSKVTFSSSRRERAHQQARLIQRLTVLPARVSMHGRIATSGPASWEAPHVSAVVQTVRACIQKHTQTLQSSSRFCSDRQR